MEHLSQQISGKKSTCSAGDTGDGGGGVLSLSREDPLEKEMATHSSIPVENPMHRRAWWAAVDGVSESDRTERLTLHFKVVSERLNALLGFCSSIGH